MRVLTADELDDAAFRLKDRAWEALVRAFDERNPDYDEIGRRICHPADDVRYWLKGSTRMTTEIIGLLAEALDYDIVFELVPRTPQPPINSTGSK